MAYDPTKPTNGSPIVSAELRSQFAGLKQLIDDLPNSPQMLDAMAGNNAGPVPWVDYLNFPVSNPPTQAEVLAIYNKIQELLDALKRA